ncbi:hypothetical protein PH213_33550 [Streptomyces sp. SRF1]|uniref:hypothetical protein n=1 Tax=Streptomyces sp. SRF1 TaxID=1549642 RepID=UPI0025B029FB|nr:hypothetical protein [Streptomyces sp. SRF1]MDN3059376.1 hypothetical protein [Streptomyces sp. SRF1]
MPRKQSRHGLYCDSTRSRFEGKCNDAARWVVYWADEGTHTLMTNYACAHHLHKLLVELIPKAEFSREMFRVIPLDELADWLGQQQRGGDSRGRDHPAAAGLPGQLNTRDQHRTTIRGRLHSTPHTSSIEFIPSCAQRIQE